jgi:peptidoglycan/LPS O-acetylase OafA/YrhL
MGRERVEWVDLLKTGAFLAVALFHFSGMIGSRFPAGSSGRLVSDSLVPIGSWGTNSFFFLSAFLLCRSMQQGSPWKAAVWRRLRRIYPGMAVMIGLYVLAAPLLPQVHKIPDSPLDAFLYVGANLLMLPGMLPIAPLVTVSWSLSYVVFGYILIGFCHRMGGAGLQRRLAVWLLVGAFTLALPQDRLVFFPLGALIADLYPMKSGGPAGFPESLRRATAVTGKHSYAVFLSHGFVLHLIAWAGPETVTLADLGALLLATLSLCAVAAGFFQAAVLGPLDTWVAARASSQMAALKLVPPGREASVEAAAG